MCCDDWSSYSLKKQLLIIFGTLSIISIVSVGISCIVFIKITGNNVQTDLYNSFLDLAESDMRTILNDGASQFDKKLDQVTNNFPMISILLKYDNNKTPAIQYITRVSKPGRRIYKKSYELPRVLSDMGIAIISTSQGVMTNKEARQKKLGGEVICELY